MSRSKSFGKVLAAVIVINLLPVQQTWAGGTALIPLLPPDAAPRVGFVHARDAVAHAHLARQALEGERKRLAEVTSDASAAIAKAEADLNATTDDTARAQLQARIVQLKILRDEGFAKLRERSDAIHALETGVHAPAPAIVAAPAPAPALTSALLARHTASLAGGSSIATESDDDTNASMSSRSSASSKHSKKKASDKKKKKKSKDKEEEEKPVYEKDLSASEVESYFENFKVDVKEGKQGGARVFVTGSLPATCLRHFEFIEKIDRKSGNAGYFVRDEHTLGRRCIDRVKEKGGKIARGYISSKITKPLSLSSSRDWDLKLFQDDESEDPRSKTRTKSEELPGGAGTIKCQDTLDNEANEKTAQEREEKKTALLAAVQCRDCSTVDLGMKLDTLVADLKKIGIDTTEANKLHKTAYERYRERLFEDGPGDNAESYQDMLLEMAQNGDSKVKAQVDEKLVGLYQLLMAEHQYEKAERALDARTRANGSAAIRTEVANEKVRLKITKAYANAIGGLTPAAQAELIKLQSELTKKALTACRSPNSKACAQATQNLHSLAEISQNAQQLAMQRQQEQSIHHMAAGFAMNPIQQTSPFYMNGMGMNGIGGVGMMNGGMIGGFGGGIYGFPAGGQFTTSGGMMAFGGVPNGFTSGMIGMSPYGQMGMNGMGMMNGGMPGAMGGINPYGPMGMGGMMGRW